MLKLMHRLNNKNSRRGNIILFIALAMLAAGSLSLYLLQDQTTTSKQKAAITVERMDEIRSRLKFYTSNMGYLYPCPARLDINESHASFGVAVANCKTLTDPQLAATPLLYSATTPQILTGAVPVRTLGLSNDYAFDGWGRYMRYQITETGVAGISVTNIDGTTNDMTSREFDNLTMTTLAVAIISAGKDGDGAYNRAGGLLSACVTLNNVDGENCDDDATLIYDRWNTATNVDYDDIVTGLADAVTSGL